MKEERGKLKRGERVVGLEVRKNRARVGRIQELRGNVLEKKYLRLATLRRSEFRAFGAKVLMLSPDAACVFLFCIELY